MFALGRGAGMFWQDRIKIMPLARGKLRNSGNLGGGGCRPEHPCLGHQAQLLVFTAGENSHISEVNIFLCRYSCLPYLQNDIGGYVRSFRGGEAFRENLCENVCYGRFVLRAVRLH